MSLDLPLVSFLISVHNGDLYLNQALNSICNQTYRNYEVIIIDDASTDSSFSIAQSFAERLPSLTLHKNSYCLGLTHSLYIGSKLCSGKWIARLDADDICEPDRIAKQLVLARGLPNVGVVGSSFYLIDENSIRLFTRNVSSSYSKNC